MDRVPWDKQAFRTHVKLPISCHETDAAEALTIGEGSVLVDIQTDPVTDPVFGWRSLGTFAGLPRQPRSSHPLQILSRETSSDQTRVAQND